MSYFIIGIPSLSNNMGHIYYYDNIICEVDDELRIKGYFKLVGDKVVNNPTSKISWYSENSYEIKNLKSRIDGLPENVNVNDNISHRVFIYDNIEEAMANKVIISDRFIRDLDIKLSNIQKSFNRKCETKLTPKTKDYVSKTYPEYFI